MADVWRTHRRHMPAAEIGETTIESKNGAERGR